MASAARNQQIREAYNVRTGSKLETFKQVNEGARFEGIGPKDKNRITMAEVRKWYLENNIGALKIQTGFNSYVAPSADHELQVDLFEYKFKQPERPKMNHTLIDGKEYDVGRAMARSLAKVDPYGIIAINPFTKKVHVESVLGKSGRDDWKPALQKIIDKMGKPKSIYTDPDASVLGNEVREWCKKNKITSVITRQHAAVAERAIRMIKKRLDDKLDSDVQYGDGEPESYWTKHVQAAVDWYNKDNVQATTNMKPVEAEKPENEFDVKTNLEINAIHRRKYPLIEVGDEVRTYRKKKFGDKERMGNFHEGTRTVEEVSKSLGQTVYKLFGDVDPYIRADLHLIKKNRSKGKSSRTSRSERREEHRCRRRGEGRSEVHTRRNETIGRSQS